MDNLKGVKSDKPFTMKLADGKEKSFGTGYDLWKWYMKYRSQGQTNNRRKKAKTKS